jgi:ABC-type nitrate/sulfonate/bicarbonate transport system permease component
MTKPDDGLPSGPDQGDRDAPPVPMRFRGQGFVPRTYPAVALLSVLLVTLGWHIAATAQANFTLLPKPGDVLAALKEMWLTGELQWHVAASGGRLLAGWTVGAGAGIIVGYAVGLFPLVRSSVLPLVAALFAVPKIAILPLFILWLGIGETSKIATIAIGVFSPMVIATYAGIDAVDRNLIRMAQSFDLPSRSIVRNILWPGALPAIMTGVRLSAAIAIVLLVASEMIAAQNGIGALALNSGSLMRTDRLFAAVVLLGLCGILVSLAIGLAERYLFRWR